MTSFEDYDGDGHRRLRQVLHDDSPEVRAQQFTRDTRGRETELTYTQHLGGYAYPPSIYYRSRQTWGDGDSAYPLEWEQTVAADMGERERPVSRVVVNDLQDGLLTAQHGYELVDDVSGSTVEWTLGVDYERPESGDLIETRWTESGTPRAWAISASRYAFNDLGVLTESMKENSTGARWDEEYELTADGCRPVHEASTFQPSDPMPSWESGLETETETETTYDGLLMQTVVWTAYSDGVESFKSRMLYEWSCPKPQVESE